MLSNGFSKKEIKKLYKKNHTVINSSEDVSPFNISQVIYCRRVSSDNLLMLGGLNWWYCINSFQLDLFSVHLQRIFFSFNFL